MERPAWLTIGFIFWVIGCLCLAIAAFGNVLGITAGSNILPLGLLFAVLSLRT
jgi:hypothetical protein